MISQLPKSDLNVHEYLHIEDEISEGGLTDREIIDVVLNKNKEEEYMLTDEDDTTPILEKVSLTEAENATNKMIRFLYKQEPEFGEVNEELRVLKELHKRIKLLIVKNLKQVNIHSYFNNNVV